MRVLARALFLLLISVAVPSAHAVCPLASHIVIQSGNYRSEPDVVFDLHNFSAELIPMGKSSPSCYQKWTTVSHGEIFISDASMTAIFSKKIASSKSKIKDLQIHNEKGRAILSGSVTKIIPIHFTIAGPVSTDGTRIRLEAQKIDADGIPIKDVLALIGEHLNGLFSTDEVRGVTVEKNALSFSPEQVAHLRGHLAGVSTENQGLLLRYESQPSRPK